MNLCERSISVGIEFGILDFIRSHLSCAALDFIMPLLTKLGDGGILWICCTVMLLLFRKTRKAGAAMAVSPALEVISCSVILKPLVARPRPYDVNAVQLLIPPLSDYSFPSGHTGAAFAAASSLFFSKNRLWIPALAIAVLMGVLATVSLCTLPIRRSRGRASRGNAWLARNGGR